MKLCFKCKTPVNLEQITRRDECLQCKSDLHVCLNCEFYEKGRANACREPLAEPVKEKERANFCDYFRFKEQGRQKSGKTEAEKLWKELFKK